MKSKKSKKGKKVGEAKAKNKKKKKKESSMKAESKWTCKESKENVSEVLFHHFFLHRKGEALEIQEHINDILCV